MLRRWVLAAALALCSGAAARQASAQDFPTRPITFVVPATAGGPTDVLARLLAEAMGQRLKQQIVIENVGGAGGTLGIARVARAAPDGYTVLVHSLNIATAAAFYRKLPYDTATAFDSVGLVNYGPYVWITRKDYGVTSPADLFARMKRDGEKVTVAHGGLGAIAHLCGVLLGRSIDAKPTLVTYRGSGPAMNDVVSGQVDMLCTLSLEAVPQIEAGAVRAIATTGSKRIDQLPTVPTFSEAGLKDLELLFWNAMWTPRGTPEAVRTALTGALQGALTDERVVRRLRELGTELFDERERTPEALDAKLRAELARWAELAQATGISIQ